MAELIVLDAQAVASLLTLEECVVAVEQAFASYARGESVLFPVIREQVPVGTGIFGVKSGYLGSAGLLGFKAGGFWVDNRSIGLPTHQSVMMLFDPGTGVARAVLDANVITRIRTGAVGVVAARALARPDSRLAAVVGCGVQGEMQTRALKLALPDLQEVRCYDAFPAAADAFVSRVADLGLKVTVAATPEAAVRGADVIVTTTPSWAPIILAEWVRPDAHISAFGADTKGKQELDPRLFDGARVVVDDLAQCRELGESQHALREGVIAESEIHAQLGEVCAGMKEGRGDWLGRTLFDATGIALQDLATAALTLALAERQGAGTRASI